jgi:transposase
MAIDVSRSKLVYCLRWNGTEGRRLSTPAELKHLQAVVAQYRECQLQVAYEACGFGYEPAWWLREQQVAVTVIAPSRVERAPGRGVKTDRMDAGKLACKLEKGELKGIYVPPRALHEQRQLGRTYTQCVRERQRAQVRIRSLLQEQGRIGPAPRAGWRAYHQWLSIQDLAAPVRASVQAHEQLRTVAAHHAQRLQGDLRQLARRADYQPLVQALCTQPGVGPLSAIRLVLELGTIERFPSGAALAHYLGLTPSQYSSGELDHRGHILKCGPGALRALLVECAWAAVHPGRDASLRAVFERVAARRGRKRAIVAVARRVAVRLHGRWCAARALTASPPTS